MATVNFCLVHRGLCSEGNTLKWSKTEEKQNINETLQINLQKFSLKNSGFFYIICVYLYAMLERMIINGVLI